MTYALNISILIIIIYRLFIGMKGGLFNESFNFVNFIFSAGMSFTLFQSLGPFVYNYIFPDEKYALAIAFWASFFVFLSALWGVKQVVFSKIYSLLKDRTISFHPVVDKAGGAIFGLLLGINLVGYMLISLYIMPVTNSLYNLREENKVIFKVDEKWLKTYSGFTSLEWEKFLDTLKPEEKEEKAPEEVTEIEGVISH
jgi:uncharacterized membrane protein required for colicin V production